MNQDCSPQKKKDKIRIQVTLSEQLSRKLNDYREKGLSYSTIVELALLDYFSKDTKGA